MAGGADVTAGAPAAEAAEAAAITEAAAAVGGEAAEPAEAANGADAGMPGADSAYAGEAPSSEACAAADGAEGAAAEDGGSQVTASAAGDGDGTPALRRKRRRSEASERHVQWDEEAIAEHDKERGTRMRIDEPPTPFVRSPASPSEDEEGSMPRQSTPPSSRGQSPASAVPAGSDASPAPASQEALGTASPRHSWAVDPSTVLASPARVVIHSPHVPKESSADFKAKRARHYDEFRALQASRQARATKGGANGDSDDELAGK
eukprot:NODE_8353_length_1502_cov_4.082182.p2 GENE.NODE_8353_length_1502_cov_4.082182~~NODE_8353_length_1502_cov_4.082182.p2  ORF type:complete len:263 (+),score=99.37 NODE_8353_length_1502_cov_4.082182:625-1413(+)